MSPRVVDRVDDWDDRPFDGGYAGMAELAADEFSGVVRAGGAEVYVTGGTVVAVRRGSIEDIEGASGTAFRAPDPALPLLSVMQEADADVRAEYYSEETPISEVDRTLSDGGFTGFLELSENVLSGDYYVVYHGGTSSSVAFVGASEQLITGDEAFEKADGEVGIYRVRQVDVEPVDVPEPAETAATSSGVDESTDDGTTGDAVAAESSEEGTTAAADDDDAETAQAHASTDEDDADGDTAQPETTSVESADSAGSDDTESVAGGAAQQGGQATRTAGTHAASGSSGQATDLETRGVPSLDPGQTSYPRRPSDTSSASAGPGGAKADARDHHGGRPPGGARVGGAATTSQTHDSGEAAADLAALESDLAEREDEIEELEAELEAARNDRAELEAELESVRDERDELASEAEKLRGELGRLEDELGAATDAEQRMTPAEAIEGTNLFVDYESKGRATLSKAHGGADSRDELVENLQLGVHTEFDQDAVAVGGRDFTEFLHETLEYRFAEWVVGQLLFEIRETGHADALTDLYDAIPEIRRVEFDGTVEVTTVDDGEEQVTAERFDVIFRHRMGDPLLVANLNDSRDPATGSMMTSLVTTAERVGQSEESLAAAFLVTSSFFESEALETVAEATKGGLLSRDKRTSFVNLSRTTGYHLCLVAAREGNFHMEVPEL